MHTCNNNTNTANNNNNNSDIMYVNNLHFVQPINEKSLKFVTIF
jgi:hypothetical protein